MARQCKKLVTTGQVFTDKVNIERVYWFKPTTVGHEFELTSLNEEGEQETFLPGRCETANQSYWYEPQCPAQDLTLETLDSGTLYLYYD